MDQPKDATEAEQVHKLARSRHAPGDWIWRAQAHTDRYFRRRFYQDYGYWPREHQNHRRANSPGR